MAGRLTRDDLALRSGAPVESLKQWQALHLIGRSDADAFDHDDIRRVRLIRLLLSRGVSLDSLVQAERREPFLDRYLDQLSELGEGGPRYSLAEVAERTGLDTAMLHRFVDAAGVGGSDKGFSDDDVSLLRGLKVIRESGLPEDALVQLLRVYSEALGRVAEAEARLFHFYVHERFRADGVSGPGLTTMTEAARNRMMPFVEPTILYFHRKGFARAVEDDALLHLQEDTGLVVPGRLRLAIAFVDLASFTPLAEVMGDENAAGVLARFSQLVHEAATRCDGRVVKQIGDAFMLVFRDARSAVSCTLEIERRAAAEPQFPAVRGGIQWGDVLYREGDYLGANVNVAARLVDAAERHQVLVTAAVREKAGTLSGVGFIPIGRCLLKGMAEETDLFAVIPASQDATEEHVVDPVCGIELLPGTAVARLVLEGEEMAFCCPTCLQRFVEAPDRYRGGRPAARR